LSEPNSPVDPRDLELLRTYLHPDAAPRARVRSRLAAVIPMGGEGGSRGREEPGPDGGPSATSVTRSLASAAAFVAGGVVGAAFYAGLVKQPPARIMYVDRPVAMSVPPTASRLAESNSAPQVSPEVAPPVSPHSSASMNHASQLSAERIMLDEARTAITQGDAHRGLDRLERHRRLFPNALLTEERDALRVQALVKAARYDEARAHADAFRRRAPGSLFLPAVDAAIASIP
jgi:hypothetical protein